MFFLLLHFWLTPPTHHPRLGLTLGAEGQSPLLRVQLEHVWEWLGGHLSQDMEPKIRVGCARFILI